MKPKAYLTWSLEHTGHTTVRIQVHAMASTEGRALKAAFAEMRRWMRKMAALKKRARKKDGKRHGE